MPNTNQLQIQEIREVQAQYLYELNHLTPSWDELDGSTKNSWYNEAEFNFRILSKHGVVKLSKDQTLPEGVFDYKQHERIFKQAGFRKVETLLGTPVKEG